MPAGRPAVFLDRDGILNELVLDGCTRRPESPLAVSEVRLMPGVARSVNMLRDSGYTVVCVTNQPAAAKGIVSAETLADINRRVFELLREDGASVEATYVCHHHPEGVVAELTATCACRKPAPGMLLAAADEHGIDLSRSWMIGDTDGDVLAGRAAGCRTVLVTNPDSVHKRRGTVSGDLEAGDLSEAVTVLVRLQSAE